MTTQDAMLMLVTLLLFSCFIWLYFGHEKAKQERRKRTSQEARRLRTFKNSQN
jgi:hypothetical protein